MNSGGSVRVYIFSKRTQKDPSAPSDACGKHESRCLTIVWKKINPVIRKSRMLTSYIVEQH